MEKQKTKKEQLKTKTLPVRMTEDEYEFIKRAAKKQGMFMSEYIIHCSMSLDLQNRMEKLEKRLETIEKKI